MVAIVTASRAPYGTYDPRFPPVVPKANDPQTPAFQYQPLTVLFPIDDGALQPLNTEVSYWQESLKSCVNEEAN